MSNDRIRTRSRVRTQITRLGTLLILISLVGATADAQRVEGGSSPLGDENYRHTLWTVKDGLYGTVQAVAQAPDGFLLIATSEGLFCFDGLVFRAVRQQTGAPILGSITSILPLSSADLWIGYALGGAAVLHEGKLTRYTEQDGFPLARVRGFATTPDGTLWAATMGGLAKFTHSHWTRIGGESGYLGRSPWTVYTDDRGRLWVPSSHSIYYLDSGQGQFNVVPGTSEEMAISIVQGKDRSIWAMENDHYRLEPISSKPPREVVSDWKPQNSTGYLLRDSRGQLWSGTEGTAAWKGNPSEEIPLDENSVRTNVRMGDRNAFLPLAGLVSGVAEDEQGNIWFATTEGLERLQPTPIRWTRLMPASSSRVLIRGPDGSVYAGDGTPGIVDIARNRAIPQAPSGILTTFNDSNGKAWIGAKDGLTLWTLAEGFHPVPLPKEALIPHPDGTSDPPNITSISEDSSGTLHVVAAGSGEFHLKNGQWQKSSISLAHPDWSPRSAFTDDHGMIWYALGDGVVSEANDRTSSHRLPPLSTFGRPNLIGGGKGDVWVGGESGIALLIGTDFIQLNECSGATIGFVTGLVRNHSGLWLASTRGITFVPGNVIDNFRRTKQCIAPLQRFDTSTGLPEDLQATAGYASSAIADAHGLLWFTTRNGVVSLDPKKSMFPAFKPSVHLTGFSADDKPYPLGPEVNVPARTNRLQFQFTAVDLVSPQRLTFRYRLVSFESKWHDAGVERVATYNGLRPGTYRFEVLASNDGNVWSEQRPILIVHLNPAWNQTKTFYVVVALAGIVFALVALTFEHERHERSLRIAFNARTAERTRMARQLHDTLLQTLQGSNLIAEHAHETVTSVAEARRIFGLLKAWLTRADGEGRAVLDVLREETTEENIERTLRGAIDQIPLCSGIVTIRTHQRSRPIHPGIREDILQICLEAVRNACIHSQSPTVTIDLYFERVFGADIKDEGIGFDSLTKPVKRPGHYGLAGMRERAAEIRGSLSIESSAQIGTLVRLTIPGKYVYGPSRPMVWLQSIWRTSWY